MGDAGMVGLSKLEYLDIAYTTIGDAGLEALAQVSPPPCLRRNGTLGLGCTAGDGRHAFSPPLTHQQEHPHMQSCRADCRFALPVAILPRQLQFRLAHYNFALPTAILSFPQQVRLAHCDFALPSAISATQRLYGVKGYALQSRGGGEVGLYIDFVERCVQYNVRFSNYKSSTMYGSVTIGAAWG